MKSDVLKIKRITGGDNAFAYQLFVSQDIEFSLKNLVEYESEWMFTYISSRCNLVRLKMLINTFETLDFAAINYFLHTWYHVSDLSHSFPFQEERAIEEYFRERELEKVGYFIACRYCKDITLLKEQIRDLGYYYDEQLSLHDNNDIYVKVAEQLINFEK